jgi:hypothetical protein
VAPAPRRAPCLHAPLESFGARLRRLDFEEAEGGRRVSAVLQLRPGTEPQRLVLRLLEEDDVLGAEWAD